MDKIKVLIVEDELIISEELKAVLIANSFEVVGQADNAESAINLATETEPDLALLDININGTKDGIAVASHLSESMKIGIVFLSAYNDKKYLDRAKLVKPHAYLTKPFRESDLLMALELAFQKLGESKNPPTSELNFSILNDRIFIREHNRFHKVMLDEIHYVQAQGSYCTIVTDKNRVTLTLNLKKLENLLSYPHMTRVHRSYIVNLQKVDSIDGNDLIISEANIPISESFRNQVLTKLTLI